jgi:hypothetical protein
VLLVDEPFDGLDLQSRDVAPAAAAARMHARAVDSPNVHAVRVCDLLVPAAAGGFGAKRPRGIVRTPHRGAGRATDLEEVFLALT